MHVNPRVFRGFSTLRNRLHQGQSLHKRSLCFALFAKLSTLVFGHGAQSRRRCGLLLLLVGALGAACITFLLHSYYLARIHELEQALAAAAPKFDAGLPPQPAAGDATETKDAPRERHAALPSWARRGKINAVSGGVWDATAALSLFDLKELLRESREAASETSRAPVEKKSHAKDAEKHLHTHGVGVVLLLHSTQVIAPGAARTLQSLLSLRNAFSGKKLFPVIISQAGSSVWQASAVAPFRVGSSGAYHMQHNVKKLPLSLSPPKHLSDGNKEESGAAASQEMESEHLLWSAKQVFEKLGLPFALFLEADLEFSPDLFGFLEKAVERLVDDPATGCASPFSFFSAPSPGALLSAELRTRLWRSTSLPAFGLLLSRQAWSAAFSVLSRQADAEGDGEAPAERKPEETAAAAPLSCLVPVLSRCRKSSDAMGLPADWKPFLAGQQINEEFVEWVDAAGEKAAAPEGLSAALISALNLAAFEKELEATLDKAKPITAREAKALQLVSSSSSPSLYRMFYSSAAELQEALVTLSGVKLPSLAEFPRHPLAAKAADAQEQMPDAYKGVLYVELPGAQVYLHGTWPERLAGRV
ncbi:Alpha-1,3-mannosyl-glycoprotein 2-beta-N-acetylglucosaminyltransferase [Besnoitia besnoiti]|uniref:Alpha-1,3-mannosyl-glycoprotein 2-beta-N-acetylglucosaminyltransferase n=1 Tax=Besnoitia besnoiti TaxID=94643 RepID=A0A2A9MLV3_BESBE|nr:Alpha-1,3-mannosyl-glycoprotein 2-beta-N-acetylglucosaminyltransferase [Besnoitia besnoiti]PFH36723.1 Alpha-1,3-mannosyl-glycoprotein 2-beta-N-acetylglucosaminyltransferase [Besnoitia besnoiti]